MAGRISSFFSTLKDAPRTAKNAVLRGIAAPFGFARSLLMKAGSAGDSIVISLLSRIETTLKSIQSRLAAVEVKAAAAQKAAAKAAAGGAAGTAGGPSAVERLKSRTGIARRGINLAGSVLSGGGRIGGAFILPYLVGAGFGVYADARDASRKVGAWEFTKRIGMGITRLVVSPFQFLRTQMLRAVSDMSDEEAEDYVQQGVDLGGGFKMRGWNDAFRTEEQRREFRENRNAAMAKSRAEVEKQIDDDFAKIDEYSPTSFKIKYPDEMKMYRKEMKKINRKLKDSRKGFFGEQAAEDAKRQIGY